MTKARDISSNARFTSGPTFGLHLLASALLALSAPALSQAQSPAAPAVAPDASNSIILRWTAPGDDGYVGQATYYDIRLQSANKGPLDTEDEWQAATQVPYLPSPSTAGQLDSVQVMNLDAGTSYYFALRTYDEVQNQSPLSNSPLLTAAITSCCEGRVGDANGLGGDEPTIGDISTMVDHLFIDIPLLWCAEEADVNQSGGTDPQQGPGGDITIGDISVLIDYLFLTGGTLPDCL